MASNAWAVHGPLSSGFGKTFFKFQTFSNFQLEIPVMYQARGHERKSFARVGKNYQQDIFFNLMTSLVNSKSICS